MKIASEFYDIARQQYAAGRIDRRQFLKISALAGIAGATGFGVPNAMAETNQVVFSNFGGDAAKAAEEVYGKPFEAATGLDYIADTSGPVPGKIAMMVKSNNVTLDVFDASLFVNDTLGAQGMLEPIDYTIVDKNKVLDGFALEYAIAGYAYSNVIAYDSAVLGGKAPRTWADLWDFDTFPGKRMFSKYGYGDIEAALLADGVPRDQLYPLDVDRAFAKISAIKDRCVFWGSGAESQQFLRDGEVSMGSLWNSRAFLVEQDTGGRVVTVWQDAFFFTNAWAVPKGNPAGKNVMRLIASMQDPAQQIEILKAIGFGPVNPAASEIMPPELRGQNPSDPDLLAGQIVVNNKWWAENDAEVTAAYLDMISS